MVQISPQEGPQTQFLSSDADIVIYGGAAGGGKTYALEMEPCRHVGNPDFGAVLLRRTSEQIRKTGGPWDESFNIYPHLKGRSNKSSLTWTFPSGAKIEFGHIQYEKDLESWLGAQICLLMFDQLETFTERMFFYMLSRNRSACGVKPYVRATCNPDSRCWLAKFLSWWIDQDTGFPIEERAGVVRWMSRIGREIHWHSSKEEAIEFCRVQPDMDEATAKATPKSVTFIPATLEDNKILMEKNPEYKSNMLALEKFDKNRLYKGNWKTRPETGEFPFHWFDDKWFERWPDESAIIVKTLALDPSKGRADKKGDYQALIKLAVDKHDTLFVQAKMTKIPIDQMVENGVQVYREFKPHGFCVEGNAFQDLLKPDFSEEFKRQKVLAPEIYLMNNSVSKVVRIRRLAGYFSQDRVRFKVDCPDTSILIDQLLDFPDGDHDDGPDALEMAIRLAEQLVSE